MDLRQTKIETKRLLLVPVSTKYAEQIFLEYREPVTNYMNYGAPENLEILESRIKEREVDMEQGTNLFMATLLKESGELLGCFALEDLNKKNPELGGWLKKAAHGHRYGQEAAAALKQWADKNLEYDYIIWPCATLNTPSRKLAESLSGKVHKEYEKKTASGKVSPYVEYRISKIEECI
ncbi:MAG: GNAT family N-acetyltransferase [Candidatus Peribacteraceae bacterium]